MKVSFLSESSADESALRIIVEGILGKKIELVSYYPLRTRGWPSILNVIPPVIKHLFYRTDAEAFVVVADSNKSPIHNAVPGQACNNSENCRLCIMNRIVSGTIAKLRPVTNRKPIETAIGLAIPSIEAWYLCGMEPSVNEAAWFQGAQSGSYPYSSNYLKKKKYGTDRPSLEIETKYAVENAIRLEKDIKLLKNNFPTGFGWLANDVRSW